MIKGLIRLGIFLVLALLGYNYFYGTVEEKAQSKEIVHDATQLGKKLFSKVGKLLKSEKAKFDDGKFDEAIGNVRNAIGDLKDKVAQEKPELKGELNDLEEKRKELAKEISDGEKDGFTKENKEKLKRKFQFITDGIKVLMDKMDK